MAELTDPPSGKPLVLRVEISAEGGATLSLPSLVPPAPTPAPERDEELERRATELDRRTAKLDEAADFELPLLDGGGVVRLSDFAGKKAVALVFGSYT